MRRSITGRVAGIMICMVAGTVMLCWILNTALLEKYYIKSKQDSLQKAWDTASGTASETLYSDEWAIALEKICAKDNITMMVMNSGSNTIFFMGNDEESYRQQFWEILFATGDIQTVVLVDDENYIIGKYWDSRLKTEYLALFGTLEDGNLLLMRTALESIRESVLISNRFLAYVGFSAIVISAVLSFLITRRITDPIRQLSELSRRMTNLDFEAKFHSKGRDELDFLGEHMNILSETLEHTISELKSANNQLQRDIQKKNEIDAMRKDFISNVSHELKTPLALIQGYAEGLLECVNEDQESRRFYCEVIMDESDKMNRMVRQLLTLNQLEFGGETVTMERFELTELIRGVVQSVDILRQQEGLTLVFQEYLPVYVWADEFKVEEALTNYLSNAIHYAAGEKRIEVTLQQREGLVRVSVFNTGQPIPEEELEHIWVKFYKVDKARTREYGGSGIGLSIVKAIMDSFHQRCGVENHPDGVEFWLELDSQSGENGND